VRLEEESGGIEGGSTPAGDVVECGKASRAAALQKGRREGP
jgi:hypothetical protein